MRNLKKVLSLALAMVMLIGMMVVGAGAVETDFRDDADINADNKEAVLVMSELSILEGYEDGSFHADGTLTRAEAAKILTYVHAGATIAEALSKTQTKFTDVPADEWYSGYVAYCTNVGIIAGSSATTFDPQGNLTAMQFAKMLLVAMGGDSTKYVGDAWATNTMRDAVVAGLNEKARVTDWNAPITRDQASQMAFNGLTGTLEGNNTYVVKVGDEVKYRGEDYEIAKLMLAVNDGAKLTTEKSSEGTLGLKNYQLESVERNDGFGRQVKVWVTNKEKSDEKTLCVSEESVDTPTKTYTTGKNEDNIADELKNMKIPGDSGDNNDVTISSKSSSLTANCTGKDLVYDNGKQKNLGANGTAIAKAIADLTGNGKTVEIYASDKVITKIVVVAKSVATLSSDPRVKDDKVTISSIGMSNVDADKVQGYEDLAKGDVVLYVKTDNGVWHLEKANSFEGTISGKDSSNKIIVDGEKYDQSGLTGTTYDKTAAPDYTATYTFYLDNEGFIVKAEKQQGTTASDNYAYVRDITWVKGNGSLSASKYAEARLVFTDGTVEIKTIAKIGDKTASESTDDTNNAKYDTIKNKWVTYSENDNGSYNVTLKGGSPVSGTEVNGGAIKFDGSNSANSNTVFVVEDTSTSPSTYSVYVGFNNLPGSITLKKADDKDTNGIGVILNNTAGTVATHVYLRATSVSGTSGDYIYIPGSSLAYEYNASEKVCEVKAIVNGEEQTIKVKATNTGAIDTDVGLKVATLLKVTNTNNDDVITAVQDQSDLKQIGISVGAGVMTADTKSDGGKNNSYKVTDDTRFFYIDTDGVCTEKRADEVTADKTDEVYVTEKTGQENNWTANVVYIIQKESDDATATIKYKVGSGNEQTLEIKNGAGTVTGAKNAKVSFDVTPADGASTTNPADVTIGDSAKTVTITVTSENGKVQSTYTITVQVSE